MIRSRDGGATRSTRVLLLAVASLVAVAIAEGGARWIEGRAAKSALAQIGERRDDPRLGHRAVPLSGENDARGMRNAVALERAEVVALGDSQTWGIHATRDETWPARLAQRSGRSVYNMGVSGYGPVHYLELLDEALALRPAWIVVALYFGNDLWDAYELTYSKEAHARLRAADRARREELADAPDIPFMAIFGRRLHFQEPGRGVGDRLRSETALGRSLTRAFDPGRNERAWARANPEEGVVYECAGVRTVLHGSYRLAGLDRASPQIREGLRITGAVLTEMASRTRAAGAELLVVFVPTKELALAGALSEHGIPGNHSLERLVRMENGARREVADALDAEGIAWSDALPHLQRAVSENVPIFPETGDGHYLGAGYERIALAALEGIQQRPEAP
jgi:lysophospholipase L1-like esterase